MRGRRGSRPPLQQQQQQQQDQDFDDTATIATIDSTTAVLQGTQNDDASAADGESSIKTFERIRNAQRKLERRPMRYPPAVAESPEERVVSTIAEEGDEEDMKLGRARIFDPRRACIIFVAFVWLIILIAVAVGSSGFAEPPSEFSTSAATPPHPTEDGFPHFHKYAYVFVAYDKSGYEVVHQLYEQLEKKLERQDKKKGPEGGHLVEQFVHVRKKFNPESKCTELNLEPNTVTILKSPEFHCNMQKLRSLLMDHKDTKKGKWGVKLVHLVRNPFSMAVANYQYRKSNPEAAFSRNPCSRSPPNLTMTIADLNSPILSENGIMTHEDLDDILSQCRGIYQTQPGLETSSYRQHLEALSPADGLRLAAADGLNPMALMASDLISFGRVRAMVRGEADNPDRKKVRYFDLMTLPLEEVLAYPGRSMMDFMEFVFGEHASAGSKKRTAAEYDHHPIVEDDADAAETEELVGLLRNDPVLGGPLTRVESLLHSVLNEREGGEIEA